MNADRFAARARTLAAHPRRTLLGALSGAVALTPLGFGSEIAATKCMRRKNKKKKKPAPTCAASCPVTCSSCYLRPRASTLCGVGLTVSCLNTCASDQDCIGTMTPYCASHSVNRMTGEVKDVGEVFGVSDPCCIAVMDCP
jgi:hypothetical protein